MEYVKYKLQLVSLAVRRISPLLLELIKMAGFEPESSGNECNRIANIPQPRSVGLVFECFLNYFTK